MSIFLVFLAIAAAGAVALAATGRWPLRRGPEPADVPAGVDWQRGEVAELDGLSEHDARLPAVLLPEHPQAQDVDRLRFSVAFRGYRMEQVDQVLEVLRGELATKEELIQSLGARGGAEPWKRIHGAGREPRP